MKKLLILGMMFQPLLLLSQKSVEITGLVGYTAVDVEYLVEVDEGSSSYAQDWGQFSYGFSTQYFFLSKSDLSFGAELMYQYLFWYSIRKPYGYDVIYRDYYMDAVKITPIFRYNMNEVLALDVGPQLVISGGARPGAMVSVNGYVPLGKKMAIPIKLRVDMMKNIVFIAPVTLNVGIRYNF